MRTRAALSCAVAVVLAAAGTGLAGLGVGTPQAPGAIRVQITLVPVNVVVTDKDDKPVTDLTRDDFTIVEDGVRQTIAHFSLQTLQADAIAPAAATQKAGLRKVPTASLEPQTRRTMVIVLGRGRLQNPSRSIDALISFVRQDLLPQDMVAVMAWNRATDFTADHERVIQVLERFRKYHEGIESKMALRFSGLAAIYGSMDIPKNLQPDIDKVFAAPGAVAARQLPPGRISDQGRIEDDARRVIDGLQRMDVGLGARVSSLDQLEVDALTDLSFEDYVSSNAQTMQDLQNLYSAVEYLRYMDGGKRLLYFSDQGLGLPRLENDQSLAALANDARVAIDTFQTGGVDATGLPSAEFADASERLVAGVERTGSGRAGAGERGRSGTFSRMFALQSLRNISRLTGGRTAIHSDIGRALSSLDALTRAEYLLGYYPKNPDWNGAYRSITVRVNRPGLKVSYRRGYYARTTLQPFDRKLFLSYSRIAAAGQYDREIKDLRVKAKATAAPAPGGGREARIDIVLDPARVPFTEENGLHVASLQFTTYYGDARGRYLGDAWHTLELKLRPSTWDRVSKEGIAFSTRVPIVTDGQTFKIVVYSYDADLVGSVTTTLKK
jgi:VWFA-related protein